MPSMPTLMTMLPGGGSAFAGNLWGPLNSDPNPTDSRGGPASTREALRFVLSPEGAFFRDFLTNEIVVSVDALSRAGAATLATSLGLGRAAVPVPLLGAARWWLPLAPALTAEDRQAIANVSVVRAHVPSLNLYLCLGVILSGVLWVARPRRCRCWALRAGGCCSRSCFLPRTATPLPTWPWSGPALCSETYYFLGGTAMAAPLFHCAFQGIARGWVLRGRGPPGVGVGERRGRHIPYM